MELQIQKGDLKDLIFCSNLTNNKNNSYSNNNNKSDIDDTNKINEATPITPSPMKKQQKGCGEIRLSKELTKKI